MTSLQNRYVGCAVVLYFCLVQVWSGIAQAPAGSKSTIVATVNGAPVTEEDLRKAAAADLDRLSMQVQQFNAGMKQAEHQILETSLDRLLADRVFEAEASRRGVTKDAFIEGALEGKIKEPTPDEIRAFYEANRARVNKPLEQVAEQIRLYLRAEARNKAIGELADHLKSVHQVANLLPPLRVKIETEGYPSKGSREAPVTIVEFSDFQCPYCSQLARTLQEVLARHPDDVRLVYRQFPLSEIHPLAEKAAEASLCAAEQNRFWELHDLMFETQGKLAEDDLKAKASLLKLDTAVFDGCLATGKYSKRVMQDQRAGYMLGVSATPAFFVNGRFHAGAVPASDLMKMIDEELRISAAHPGTATIGSTNPSPAPSSAKAP